SRRLRSLGQLGRQFASKTGSLQVHQSVSPKGSIRSAWRCRPQLGQRREASPVASGRMKTWVSQQTHWHSHRIMTHSPPASGSPCSSVKQPGTAVQPPRWRCLWPSRRHWATLREMTCPLMEAPVMRKILYLLGQLNDMDLAWILANGRKEK